MGVELKSRVKSEVLPKVYKFKLLSTNNLKNETPGFCVCCSK